MSILPISLKRITKQSRKLLDELVISNKVPAGTTLGATSRIYLVKLTYDGTKYIEMFMLESVFDKGLRDFKYSLLRFGVEGIGGQNGIIPINKRTRSYLNNRFGYPAGGYRINGIETNVERYVPYTTYANIANLDIDKDQLVIKERNGDSWIIQKVFPDDDFEELAKFILSGNDRVKALKKANQKKYNRTTHTPEENRARDILGE